MISRWQIKSVAAFGLLLLGAVTFARETAAQVPTAYNEAAPRLRDAAVVVLDHVRIIDGTGAPAAEDQRLVVAGGRIRAIGDAGTVVIPPGAEVLDLAGQTVLPGLVMLHEHLGYNSGPQHALQQQGLPGLTHPQHFSSPRLFLAFGVTTIRTAGADHPYADLNLKRGIDAGAVPGPEIHPTGPFFSGEGDPFLSVVLIPDAEAARRAVQYWAAEGITSFKVYKWIPEDALTAVIEEAHRLGLAVTAHLGSGGVSCRRAAELGIDNLEHGFFPCIRADGLEPGLDGPKTEVLLRALVDGGVVLTLTYDRRGEPLSDEARVLLDPSARMRYERALAERPPAASGSAAPGASAHTRLVHAFVRAGGRIVLGSDAGCCGGGNQIAGLASHTPFHVLVEMGFSPLDAIRIGTLEGARFLGIADRTGSIEIGKEADLLVVRGRPDERIEDLGQVRLVMANGVPFDPARLLDRVAGQVGWR